MAIAFFIQEGKGPAGVVISTLQTCWEAGWHRVGAQSITCFLLPDFQPPVAASDPGQLAALSVSQEQQWERLSLGHGPGQGQLSWRGLNELPVCILATYIIPFWGGGGLPSPGTPAQLWLAQPAGTDCCPPA